MTRRIAIQGGRVMELDNTPWTPEQIKRIEASGFFELRPVALHVFGRVHWLTRSDYRALLTIMWLVLVGVCVMVAAALSVVIRP